MKIGSERAEIFLIWTNVAKTNVAWTNVTVTVTVNQVGIVNFSFLARLEVAEKFVVGW